MAGRSLRKKPSGCWHHRKGKVRLVLGMLKKLDSWIATAAGANAHCWAHSLSRTLCGQNPVGEQAGKRRSLCEESSHSITKQVMKRWVWN